MEIIFSGAEAQKMDEISIRDYHFPGLTLMENAGERIFQAIQFHYEEIFPVGFLIGKGNNGGDGLVIARKMFQAGYSVGVFILAQGEGELSQSAKINFQILRSLKVPYQWIPDQDHYEASRNTLLSFPVLIDALLGIGLNSPLKGIIKTVVEDLNRDYGGKIWAIDVPTGLSTGEEYFEPILKADHTFTVEMPKNHMIDYPGRSFVGKLDAVKIGFPEAVKKELSPKRFLVEESDVEIPRRQRDSHKGTYGKTLIAAGSRQYTGAALLTLSTAARTGTGLLHYLGESEEYVRNRFPEVIVVEDLNPSEFRSVLAGPGWGDGEPEVLQMLFDYYKGNLIIDADGINLLSRNREILQDRRKTLLTPHLGEFSRLIDRDIVWIKKNKEPALEIFAGRYPNVSVLLKDSVSIFYHQGISYYLSWGSPLLAKGGSGDLLAGLIAGFASYNTLKESVFLASYLNGKTAEILNEPGAGFFGEIGELPGYYHLALKELEKSRKSLQF